MKEQIGAIFQQTGIRPWCSTPIVLPEIRDIILQSEGFCQDIVQALVAPCSRSCASIRRQSLTAPGLTPGNLNKYDARIAAIDYTLAHDDGISLRNLDQAQVILLGVSRCGKTPPACIWRCSTVSAPPTTRLSPMIWTTDSSASLKPLAQTLRLNDQSERLAAIREERRKTAAMLPCASAGWK